MLENLRKFMKPYNCNLISHKVIINIQTDSVDLFNFLQQDPILHSHIPDLLINKTHKKYHFQIKHITNSHNKVVYKKRLIKIYTRVPETVKYSQFIFLILPILEYFYENIYLYSLCGAALSNNKKGIVFLGSQRSGKSTLTAILSGLDSLNYYSDERMILDLNSGEFLGGNKIISLRKNMIQNKTVIKLLKRFPIYESKSTDKVYYLPNKTRGINAKLKYVFLIQLNNTRFYTTKMTNFDVKLQLYNNITQTIRSCLNPIINLGFSTPSFDNDVLASTRLTKISCLVDQNHIEGYELNGTICDIRKWIKEIIR